MAMFSVVVDFLPRDSFRSPKLRLARVALLTHWKDVRTAAHLFDARRPLPPHSCQGPWGWGIGRTSGMKGSFVSAATAVRGQLDGRPDSTRGAFRSVHIGKSGCLRVY